MGRMSLDIELIDELIFSQRAASLGGHRSLDRIPGASLLGAAAADLYRKLDRKDAWTLFHSGRVRFGDGLPISAASGDLGWPVPLCWHHAKGEEMVENRRFKPGRVFNLLRTGGELPDDGTARQPKQLRDIYVTATGERLCPATEFRMRTAIDPETGRAADSQLFGFESLRAGQRFQAGLEWDDDVPPPLIGALREFFAGRDLLLGRSRSAQFGRARCVLRDGAASLPETCRSGDSELSLWLLSDLAAIDRNGFPTLTPTAEDLGLPLSATPLTDKTFTRFRAYAPYNGHQRLFGRERQVIAAGSVLTFGLRQAPTDTEWQALGKALASGLGLYREAGLGRCVPNPALLLGATPSFPSFAPKRAGTGSESTAPPMGNGSLHPYARWLSRIALSRDEEANRKAWAESALNDLEALEKNARALNGLSKEQPASPGKSQWGRVAQEAKFAAQAGDDLRDLREGLFGEAAGVCKPDPADWGRQTQLGNRPITYADWLRDKLAEREAVGDAAIAVGLLAELAQKRLNTLEGR